jgi:hypothetical protein
MAASNFAPAIYSHAANTIISKIRVRGAAIKPPRHSRHWSNISVLGASSQVKDSVANVIRPAPATSGNQLI